MTQTGTLALATLPFLGRGSVLIDLGMPTGARPTFYAAEYVYATFDHVQVCSCTHPSSPAAASPSTARTTARAYAISLNSTGTHDSRARRMVGAGRQASSRRQ